MGTSEVAAARRPSRRSLLLIALAVLVIAALAVVSATSLAYGSTVRGGDQLLPGTTIASVDVSEVSADEAIDRVTAHLDAQLDRTVTVVHGDTTWTTTPRELGARTDVDQVVATAAGRAADLGFADLVQLRWLGSSSGLAADVTVSVPEEQVEGFVDGLVDELDREPVDAELAWEDDAVVVTTEGRDGRTVRYDEAVATLTEAVTGGDEDEVVVPLDRETPAVPNELAETVAADVGAAVDAALDHSVTVTLDDRSESVTPREVGAVPAVEPLVAAAVDGDAVDADDVQLELPEGALSSLLDRISEGTVVPARDASLDLSDGFRIVPERVGASIDRGEATEQIRTALAGADDRVDLELRPLRPTVTADSFDTVLVVEQSRTTVTLYRGGEAARSWPVAVGTNNSPTPTGTFVVGAKRFEPTWVNPAPDRWGRDMPARIGPGPDNPLGVRAINWNTTGGADTLIRFHGTPNEASIGSAASNGCVRMFNSDVVELYDLISPGTTIISLA